MKYSASWFAEVLNAMSEMVLVKGPRSHLLWANKAFLKYYGMSNEDLMGIVDAQHSDPDDTLQYVRDDHHVFTSGDRLDVDEPVTDAAGAISYFRTIKTAIQDDDGLVVRTVGVSRPIDGERAAKEAASTRAEAKKHLSDLRVLVQDIPIAVAMLDAKQRIVARSGAWDELLGATPETQYFDEQQAQLPVSNHINTAIIEGAPFVLEAVSFSDRLVNVHGQPFLLPSGKTGGVILVVHDVTPLHRQRIELERLNDELNQFNYRVSHDLVGPIRTLKGLVNLVRTKGNERSDSVVTSALSRMSGCLEQLEELVEGVVNLARSDGQERVESVDLKLLVNEILQRHPESKASRVRISVDCEEVLTEKIRLQQCLENLIGNALKYRDPVEATAELEIECSRDSVGSLRIEVSDNGLGIDEIYTAQVFDRFWRGSALHKGSGLGLHLVKKHAERLGGNVALIHNRKPTIFRLTLPRIASASKT